MIKISAKNVDVFYGKKQALFNINLDIEENQVTALIGPSGCGKSKGDHPIIQEVLQAEHHNGCKITK